MGSVTKTMIETSGEVQCSTTLHFDSFEDFMKYELVVGDSGKTFTKDEIDINLNTSVDNTNNPKKINVGEYYRVVGNAIGHEFPLGSMVKVVDSPFEFVGSNENEIVYKAQQLDGKDWWWVKAEDLEEDSE